MASDNLEKVFRSIGISFFASLIATLTAIMVVLFIMQHFNLDLTNYLKVAGMIVGISMYLLVSTFAKKFLLEK